ncbi:MAG: RNA polymerase sigma factor [Bacteroidales bacterium]|nr:RNA polymerase sigma factor [Bacteroidales bacterium]
MRTNVDPTLTDEEIIRKIQSENSSEYFQILYDRYHRKVLDKCYTLVKNKTTAHELAEDIFSKVFEKLGSFKFLSSFSSWLYSISYNFCIDYLRYKKKMHYPDWNRENEIPEIIDETGENLNEISYENLLQIFEQIHPEEKALILMKYQDNLSLKQIGESLRISEDAAKMRLKRARSRVIYLYMNKFYDK